MDESHCFLPATSEPINKCAAVSFNGKHRFEWHCIDLATFSEAFKREDPDFYFSFCWDASMYSVNGTILQSLHTQPLGKMHPSVICSAPTVCEHCFEDDGLAVFYFPSRVTETQLERFAR